MIFLLSRKCSLLQKIPCTSVYFYPKTRNIFLIFLRFDREQHEQFDDGLESRKKLHVICKLKLSLTFSGRSEWILMQVLKETNARKSSYLKCALIHTKIHDMIFYNLIFLFMTRYSFLITTKKEKYIRRNKSYLIPFPIPPPHCSSHEEEYENF
jgi:hypothetical protein